MSTSNSYVRAFIVCVFFFIAVVVWMFQEYGPEWSSHHLLLIVSILGFALMITSVLVGTFSHRSEKPWPWWKVGLSSLGCGLLVLYLMLFIQERFVR
jgi:hypothetical protein